MPSPGVVELHRADGGCCELGGLEVIQGLEVRESASVLLQYSEAEEASSACTAYARILYELQTAFQCMPNHDSRRLSKQCPFCLVVSVRRTSGIHTCIPRNRSMESTQLELFSRCALEGEKMKQA